MKILFYFVILLSALILIFFLGAFIKSIIEENKRKEENIYDEIESLKTAFSAIKNKEGVRRLEEDLKTIENYLDRMKREHKKEKINYLKVEKKIKEIWKKLRVLEKTKKALL